MLRYRLRECERNFFEKPQGMSDALYRLLMGRGISSAEEAERFLRPTKEQLRDPMLLHDMPKAVERIRYAIAQNEALCVYGDYDVDGVSAASILSDYLRRIGGNVRVYIPSRHKEGYGMNDAAVRNLAETGIKLIVTVDCGITNIAQIALAKELGVDCVVTDHHRPGDTLPDCPVVDPLLGDYPFGFLCGGGVAFKLVAALGGYNEAMKYIDIAALATVADLVPLQDENRVIVRLGLQKMNLAMRPGLAALRDVAGLDPNRPVRSETIGFQFGPRLNAGGRLGSAMRSLNLLLAEDIYTAQSIAEELHQTNEERKQCETDIMQDCERMMKDFDFLENRAIVLASPDWNSGVIGLAASRLSDKYNYPTILLAVSGDTMTGSCRSIEGVDIHQALTAVKHFFIRFGGHKQAAGLSMKTVDLDAFRDALNDWLRRHISPALYVPSMEYDLPVALEEVDASLVEGLEALQPFGLGNPSPVFRAHGYVTEARTMGKNDAHLKLTLAENGQRHEAVYWQRGYLKKDVPQIADAIFSAGINEYMGRKTVQLVLKGLQTDNPLTEVQSKTTVQGNLLHDSLTELFYNSRIFSESCPYESLDPDALTKLLSASPQGTLILAGDLPTAEEILKRYAARTPDSPNAPDVPPPDIFFGEADERIGLYNAMIVYPTGRIPAGYRNIVFVGIPFSLEMSKDAKVYRVGHDCNWFAEIPDVDELREICRAAFKLDGKSLFGTELVLSRLEEMTRLSNAKVGIGLSILEHMQLVRLTKSENGETIGLTVQRGIQSNPKQDSMFDILHKWKTHKA